MFQAFIDNQYVCTKEQDKFIISTQSSIIKSLKRHRHVLCKIFAIENAQKKNINDKQENNIQQLIKLLYDTSERYQDVTIEHNNVRNENIKQNSIITVQNSDIQQLNTLLQEKSDKCKFLELEIDKIRKEANSHRKYLDTKMEAQIEIFKTDLAQLTTENIFLKRWIPENRIEL
jgi:hypothetical protein